MERSCIPRQWKNQSGMILQKTFEKEGKIYHEFRKSFLENADDIRLAFQSNETCARISFRQFVDNENWNL